MYVEASTNLKQQVARVAALEGERAELSKRLGVVETRLRQSTDLHDLQVCVWLSGMPLSLPCPPVIAHSFFCYVHAPPLPCRA